jgi:hypothetical protein
MVTNHPWRNLSSRQEGNMRFTKNSKVIAVILILLGVVALEYSYLTFIFDLTRSIILGIVAFASSGTAVETQGKPLDFHGIQFETTGSHFIPAVIGAITLVGGIVLLAATLLRGLTDGAAPQPSGAVTNRPQEL